MAAEKIIQENGTEHVQYLTNQTCTMFQINIFMAPTACKSITSLVNVA